MDIITKEITMYAFTKPQPSKSDLANWKEHFALKGRYSEIQKTPHGYVLLVEGEGQEIPEEKSYYQGQYDPVRGPCIYCGGTDHIERYNQFDPHFRFCDKTCVELYKRRLANEKDKVKNVRRRH